MENRFKKNLEIGTDAEDKVYFWLKAQYSYVQDMRYQKHEKGSGPRLEGRAGFTVLPDFAVYDKFNGKFLIDVKYKSNDYFTVDDYKMNDYLQCMQLLGMDKLLLCFVYKDDMYFYDSSEKIGPIQFNNSYGKAAYKFEVNRSKIKI